MTIKGKKYYVTDEVNGSIYEIIYENNEEDVGNKIGKITNSIVKFHKKNN